MVVAWDDLLFGIPPKCVCVHAHVSAHARVNIFGDCKVEGTEALGRGRFFLKSWSIVNYNVVLVSSVQQSNLVIYIYIYIYINLYVYAAAAAAKLLQSCLTLCYPMDGSPPGSSVPGILQARIMVWVAISCSLICVSVYIYKFFFRFFSIMGY